MSSPPFSPRLAQPEPAPVFQISARLGRRAAAAQSDDACCAPGAGAHRTLPAPIPVPKPQRATLADLELHLHCSIVGTCLTTGELRKLVPRHAPHVDRRHASDLEIHHAAVELCCDGGPGRKDINKALDARHALAIRKFKAATEPEALRTLWTAAMTSGEVPGAYWALMTHPSVTPELRALAFGDVHMLSNMVGASNRADIRRLVALEAECAALKEQNERQQARLRELSAQHAATTAAMARELDALREAGQQAAVPAEVADELARLRAALAERDAELALHAARRASAERKAETNATLVRALELRVDQAEDAAAQARTEVVALEDALRGALDPDAGTATLPALRGQSIAYIGGRPGTTAILGDLVRAAGGEWLAHDGGVEDRKGTLAALLARATVVVFPVDCVSHNAMDIVKRVCNQSGLPYHPLRSAGVAGCVLLLRRLFGADEVPAAVTQAPRSRFCLRHG